MRWIRITLFMAGGAVIMLLSLMWVAQFFVGDGDSTPVIWLENLREDAAEGDDGDFSFDGGREDR